MLFFRAQRRACFESLNVLDFHGVPPCHLWLEKGKPTWSSLTCPAYWSLAAWQSAWRSKTWRPNGNFWRNPHVKGVEKWLETFVPQKCLKRNVPHFFSTFFLGDGSCLEFFWQEIIPQKKGRGTQDDWVRQGSKRLHGVDWKIGDHHQILGAGCFPVETRNLGISIRLGIVLKCIYIYIYIHLHIF